MTGILYCVFCVRVGDWGGLGGTWGKHMNMNLTVVGLLFEWGNKIKFHRFCISVIVYMQVWTAVVLLYMYLVPYCHLLINSVHL